VNRHFIIVFQTLPLCGIKVNCTYSVIKDSIIVVLKKIYTYTVTHLGSLATLFKKKIIIMGKQTFFYIFFLVNFLYFFIMN